MLWHALHLLKTFSPSEAVAAPGRRLSVNAQVATHPRKNFVIFIVSTFIHSPYRDSIPIPNPPAGKLPNPGSEEKDSRAKKV